MSFSFLYLFSVQIHTEVVRSPGAKIAPHSPAGKMVSSLSGSLKRKTSGEYFKEDTVAGEILASCHAPLHSLST